MLEQLTVFKNKSLMMVYLITALGYGGTFVVYTYLTTLLTDTYIIVMMQLLYC